MELKYGRAAHAQKSNRSNRTFMELKLQKGVLITLINTEF